MAKFNEGEGEKLMTMIFEAKGDEIGVSTDFHKDISIKQFFWCAGKAIEGLMTTAQQIGQAEGMTEEQVNAAIFESAGDQTKVK